MTLRILETAGAKLTFEETGPGTKAGGPVLIFLHYWGGSARTWTPVTALLPPSLPALALNQRGWGGSVATDGRYDLDAYADDVEALVRACGLSRFVLVGHSMGGKIAQILAGRRVEGLAGLVLVAPAPPMPMQVPAEIRAGMLASYQSPEGVEQALGILAGSPLPQDLREQVAADTLGGVEAAKRSWPEQGMVQEIGTEPADTALPVTVLIGARDRVEREDVLRPAFARFLPQASFTVVPGAGHLLPLEAPASIAVACDRMVSDARMVSELASELASELRQAASA